MSQIPPQQSAVSPSPEPQDRLEDLIALETAGMADPAELQELAALSRNRRDARQLRRQMANAASAVTLGTLTADPVSRDLRRSLIRSGLTHLSASAAPSLPNPKLATRRVPWLAFGGYAAAACLAILLLLRPSADRGTVASTAQSPTAQALLSEAGTVRIPWTATNPESPAGGEVVWSEKYQAGFMRFANFTPNRPDVSQYQLWIFDESRPEATPVDGGVFDVPSTGEVIVPIRPTLKVSRATLFAITEEPPGGVVVSDRSKLHLIAARP